ncbi:SGNH/GDSL hydrolase family protein [Streptomyces sp. DH37]|uniref:GDSL-type esterase/lipase family protein n=1 Tax=Streptomyces sp. DH37 TaxID=3040122 RepID=UPI002442850B|nr:SGNH/GDSL hydrolase family protein [Streptomyces sp. DH37]MDG9706408.1 SGNH/GDSL hydrolase family protein [Streptomyces sp. DH37]
MTELIDVPLIDGPVAVRGARDLERTAAGLLPHRLPARARAQLHDPHFRMVEAQPAGVRLVFRTAATVLRLEVLATKTVLPGDAAFPDGVYELFADGEPVARASVREGNRLHLNPFTGQAETVPGPAGAVSFTGLPAREKEIELWLPQAEVTELIALRADAPVLPPSPSRRPVWLHHGSSISHGADQPAPTGVWPAVAASLGGVELVNLGLAGHAMLDPFTARAMRDTPADLISLKVGINIVGTDSMRLRALTPAVHGFLDTIRDGHPDTPLLVVSPILCPEAEERPGPLLPRPGEEPFRFRALGDPSEVPAGRLTLGVVRAELARIVAERSAGDPNLHYLDGRELYGEEDAAALPLPDALHPDAATHRLIGERFAELAFGASGPLRAGGDRASRPGS